MRRRVRGGVGALAAGAMLLVTSSIGVSHALWRDQVTSPTVMAKSRDSHVGVSLVRLDESGDRQIAEGVDDELWVQLTRQDAQAVLDSQDQRIVIPLRVDLFATDPYGIDYRIEMPSWDGNASVLSQSTITLWMVRAASDADAVEACQAASNTPFAAGDQTGSLPPSGSAVHYWCLMVDHSHPSYRNTVTVTGSSEIGEVEPASANWSVKIGSDTLDYYKNTVSVSGLARVAGQEVPLSTSADWLAHMWERGSLGLTHELTR